MGKISDRQEKAQKTIEWLKNEEKTDDLTVQKILGCAYQILRKKNNSVEKTIK
jgi:hypothetical protein